MIWDGAGWGSTARHFTVPAQCRSWYVVGTASVGMVRCRCGMVQYGMGYFGTACLDLVLCRFCVGKVQYRYGVGTVRCRVRYGTVSARDGSTV